MCYNVCRQVSRLIKSLGPQENRHQRNMSAARIPPSKVLKRKFINCILMRRDGMKRKNVKILDGSGMQ